MSSEVEQKPETITASDYILQNFEESDRIAILILSRGSGETLQRITSARNAASGDFQQWLRHKNLASDVYVGMNWRSRVLAQAVVRSRSASCGRARCRRRPLSADLA